MVQLENLHFDRKSGTARLQNRMNSILQTINNCIKMKWLFPALTLIYSSIDVLGSFQNRHGYASKNSFEVWVTRYFLTARTFSFNEHDLYGARCGIVHTMGYCSRDATLKIIVYGFHGHDIDIQKITDTTKQAGVYVEDLFDALCTAYSQYLEHLENSSDSIINNNLDKLPNYVDLIPLD
jgi:hypothetical protein